MSTLFGAEVRLLHVRAGGIAALAPITANVGFLEQLSIAEDLPEPVDPRTFQLGLIKINGPNGTRYFVGRTLYARNESGSRVFVGEYAAHRVVGRKWLRASDMPAIVLKVMLSPTTEHRTIRALNSADARRVRPGCDRIPAVVLKPQEDSLDTPTKNRHLCIVAMAKAAGDLSSLGQALGGAALTTWECLRVVRGVLEEVKACYDSYGMLHMDVKQENFLFSRAAGGALRVVLSDYGGLAEEGRAEPEELKRPTYPPLDGLRVPALVKVCLYQFGPLLMQIMGARDVVRSMHSHSGVGGIWQAYADLFGMRTLPRISTPAYA